MAKTSGTNKAKSSHAHTAKEPTESQAKGKLLEPLVKGLEAALADRKCMIKARHRVKDRATGQPREVDIYIEEHLRGELRRTMIECRYHKALVNLTYIEQVVTKRADLGSPHTCIVSRSGFTKGAIAKAKHHGIVLSALEEVKDPLWPAWFADGFSFVELVRSVERVSFIPVVAGSKPTAVTLTEELLSSDDESLIFLDREGAARESITSLIKSSAPRWPEEWWDEVLHKGKKTQKINIRFRNPLFVHFKEGLTELAGFIAELELEYQPALLPMTFSRYRDAHSASTKAETAHTILSDGTMINFVFPPGEEKRLIAIVPPEGRGYAGQIMIEGEDAEGKPLFAIIKVQEPNDKTK